jgi:hypothetical protein
MFVVKETTRCCGKCHTEELNNLYTGTKINFPSLSLFTLSVISNHKDTFMLFLCHVN